MYPFDGHHQFNYSINNANGIVAAAVPLCEIEDENVPIRRPLNPFVARHSTLMNPIFIEQIVINVIISGNMISKV